MKQQPTLFISHGAPTFAMEPGKLGPLLMQAGQAIGRPKAIVVVSPHWITPDVRVTVSPNPKTIHDFGGFPQALYEIIYPAPGAPDVAQQVIATLEAANWTVHADTMRGLDHGAWVPLTYLYPDASVPVIQVSLPNRLDARGAYAFGQALAPLRDAGILIVASGSMTHNLYEFRARDTNEAAYAREFSDWIKDVVTTKDHARLMQTMDIAPHAQRAHPTVEHFLPLLVAAGAAGKTADVTLLDGGIEHGVLSMDSYVFAAQEGAGHD
jgi:4,5-DOPA dioxygenase extradiol